MKNSLFISFEGIEGSGKSTQIQRIKEYLNNLGFTVSLHREPGGTTFGENLRKAILESQDPVNPLSEAMLFASSRAQLLHQEILPKLKEDKHIVIVDRFIDSSLAYQGTARGLGHELVLDIHKHSPLDTRPDLTFYLKIDLETSMERQKQRGQEKDYFEKEKAQFYQKLIEGYDKCADAFDRIVTINGKQDIDKISEEIKTSLEKTLNG